MLSDNETNSSNTAGSPESYFESPHSSPTQQVPQRTMPTCPANNYMDLSNNNSPFLVITEQPLDYFRFRYKSEMSGTHGSIIGKSSSGKVKTYPSVKLMKYDGKAIVRCRLVQANNDEDHPHQLVEDEQDKDLYVEVGPNKFEVRFSGMAIIHTAKKEVTNILLKNMSKKSNAMSIKQLRCECEQLAKKINLNIVRLKFSAHRIDTNEEICPPVFSEPIHNMKSAATNDLKICRMSRSAGTPRGGEDVYILTEKVNKKNIEVRFIELDTKGNECWSEKGIFLVTDVHHQYAIVCRTPAYKTKDISTDVTVYIELVRPSDGRTSERTEFTYIAEPSFNQRKRRKPDSFSSFGSSSDGSIKSVSELPVTVTMSNLKNHEFNLNDVLMNTIDTNNMYCQDDDNNLAKAIFENTVKSHEVPLVANPFLSQAHSAVLPELSLKSGDIEKLNDITDEYKEAFDQTNIHEYFQNFTVSGNGSFGLIGDSDIFKKHQLHPDSGVPRNVNISTASTSKADIKIEINTNTDRSNSKYDGVYSQKDGLEVKVLVNELCNIIRNKSMHKKVEVKAKLERLFELRLSNGDTFLHMTLRNNILPSMMYIIKLIHSLRMTHLLNEKNNNNQTILHFAILHELIKEIPFLISKGCDPIAQDYIGNTAVHYAVKCKRCLKPLLEAVTTYGVVCDLNIFNKEKQTALHLATTYGSASCVKTLLSHNASYSVSDTDGRTPLHLACYDAKKNVIDALLQHIPDSEIDVTDGQGNTAFQILCGNKNNPADVEIIEMFLQKGANPFLGGDKNPSAFKLSRGNHEIINMMKKYSNMCIIQDEEIKSEPEEEFESADEGDSIDTGLDAMSLYIDDLSKHLDRSGKWKELAISLKCDFLMSYFENSPSPTKALLNQVKENSPEISSEIIGKMLRDMGEFDAALVILKCI